MFHQKVCFVRVSHFRHIELDSNGGRTERLPAYSLKYNMVDDIMGEWKPKEVKQKKYLYFSRGV